MIVLVLGGARSGKSRIAEAAVERLSSGATITYVATAAPAVDDPDHAHRIELHQRRRPSAWATVEPDPGRLVSVLDAIAGPVIVDSLGSWLARHQDFAVDPTALLTSLRTRSGPTVLVSDEVGMTIHPATAAGRAFVDALGALNQQVAAIAHRTVLVVAGRVLDLSPADDFLHGLDPC
jgi:adenosylcobinamide kinase/adenosylcobinamide-phosphate guanylyltransferase